MRHKKRKILMDNGKGAYRRRYTHSRQRLLHADRDLLSDRPYKLFKDGFCTGHGYLRAPQSIMSYASLACIAIQAKPERNARRSRCSELRLFHGSRRCEDLCQRVLRCAGTEPCRKILGIGYADACAIAKKTSKGNFPPRH